MTSSPGPAPRTSCARWSAAPQLLVLSTLSTPATAANSRSKARQAGPAPDSQPEAKTSAIAASSSSPTVGCPRAYSTVIVPSRTLGRRRSPAPRSLVPLNGADEVERAAAGVIAGSPHVLAHDSEPEQHEAADDQHHP